MSRFVTSLTQRPHATSSRARWLLTDLLDLVHTWTDVAKQRRHLASMDDRMLRDIGLSRADVAREIDRPFWDVKPSGGYLRRDP